MRTPPLTGIRNDGSSGVSVRGSEGQLTEKIQRFTDSQLPVEVSPGIIIQKDYDRNPTLLKAERFGKMGLTTGAVFFQSWASLSLLWNSLKLFASTLGFGNTEESFKGLSKSYTKSAIAGTLTGVANESSYWSIGNLGMGLFSRYLNTMPGLAAFSIADGLASIGRGQVRYRDKGNAFSVQHSIFNKPQLSFLKFLMPIEQSMIGFVKKVGSLDFKRFIKDEPYALFQNAGGGLILGGLLGLAAYPLQKITGFGQSLGYLSAGGLATLNNLALFMDGKKVNERATDHGGRDKSETYLMKTEGLSKMIAAPLLGVNNLLLGLKGFGLDTKGGLLYNLAMSLRSISVSIASIADAAQSATKYINPDTFGPTAKRVVKVLINPKEVMKEIQAFLLGVEKEKEERKVTASTEERDERGIHKSDKFQQIIDNDPHSKIFHEIEGTSLFQSLKEKSQAGLASPMARDRAFLERYTHSTRVGAIGVLMFDALCKNTTEPKLAEFLKQRKLQFKIACYVHDIGHIMRSHLAEKGVKGHDNDELTVDLLKESEIVDKIREYCKKDLTLNEEKTNDFLQEVRDLVGLKSPLSKLLKLCDFTEYVRGKGSDFNSGNSSEYPHWSIEKIKDFAEEIRLYSTPNGRIKLAVTEKAALEPLRLYYDRYRFNEKYNSEAIINARELAYLIGLDASDVSLDEVMSMSRESELDEKASKGVETLNGEVYTFETKTIFGGKKAYCGWNEEKNGYYVQTKDGTFMKIFDYGDKVLKQQDKEAFEEFEAMRSTLTTPVEKKLVLEVIGSEMYRDELEKVKAVFAVRPDDTTIRPTKRTSPNRPLATSLAAGS